MLTDDHFYHINLNIFFIFPHFLFIFFSNVFTPMCCLLCFQLMAYSKPIAKVDPAVAELRREIGSYKA